MEVLTNNGTFFNELNRIANYEKKAANTRIPSIANTYKYESQVDKTFNLSYNYARKGQQKFADPFAFKSRLDNSFYNGRNLNILNTLKINAKKDSPDVITKTPLKVVGYY